MPKDTVVKIAFLEDGGVHVYDKNNDELDEMDPAIFANHLASKTIKKTLSLTYLETNSGIIIIGGKPYYIP